MNKKKRKFLGKKLLYAFFLSLPLLTIAAEIRHEHPRLYLDFLRSESIKRLITTPENNPQWTEIKNYADKIVADNNFDSGYRGLKMIRLLLFANQFSNNASYIDAAQTIFTEIRKPFSTEKDALEVCPKVEAAALLYDWEYDELTNSEKQAYVSYILDAVQWFSDGGYLSLTGLMHGGHHIEAHRCALIGLIAIKYDTALVDKYLPQVVSNLFDVNGYLPFYRFLSEQDGGFHMGFEYTRYYHFDIIDILDLWRSATGEDLFSKNKWLIKSQRFQLAGLNDQADFFKIGDVSQPHLGPENRLFALKIAQEYQDGIAQTAADWMRQHHIGTDTVFLIYDLLWSKSKVAKLPLTSLPTANLFSRVGIASFKQSWKMDNKKNSVTAIFKSTPTYFTNHSHRDVNSFSLSLQGDLALDSGYYDEYQSEHWRHYYTQSIAHNTVVFENEKTKEFIGQENRDAPDTLKQLQNGKFDTGGITAFEQTKLYSYAKGIAQKAYPAGLIDKFDRHFVFLTKVAKQNKPVVVIFDDIKLRNKNSKPTWLLHCLTQPLLINEHELNCTNEKSRLDLSIIVPQTPKITLVGGKDAEFVNNGINYPTMPYGRFKGLAPDYAGSWRVEVQNKDKPTESFLMILAAKNKSESQKLSTQQLDNHGQAWQGVELENWRVLFNQNEVNQTMDFTVASQQDVLVLGLSKKQAYLISGLDNKPQAMEFLSSDAGTLLIKAKTKAEIHLQRKLH